MLDNKSNVCYLRSYPDDAGPHHPKGPSMAGKQVDKTSIQFTDIDQVRNRFNLEAETTEVEGDSLKEWQEGIIKDVMNATDFEAINAAAEANALTQSKECIGRTFRVEDIAIRESAEAFRANSILQKFVIMKVIDVATGEEVILDGGGDTFVAQAMAMRDRYGFPFIGTIRGKRTSNGYDVLYWKFQDPQRKPLF